jgi:hypothetical protein
MMDEQIVENYPFVLTFALSIVFWASYSFFLFFVIWAGSINSILLFTGLILSGLLFITHFIQIFEYVFKKNKLNQNGREN